MTTIPDCPNPPPAREGCFLSWLVVNREGKLLAIVDSESEAYHYQKGRAHAEGGRYFKATLDYAGAPDMQTALREIARELARHPDAQRGNSTVHFALMRARAFSSAAPIPG